MPMPMPASNLPIIIVCTLCAVALKSEHTWVYYKYFLLFDINKDYDLMVYNKRQTKEMLQQQEGLHLVEKSLFCQTYQPMHHQ